MAKRRRTTFGYPRLKIDAHHPGLERRMVFMTGGAFTPCASEFLARVPNLRLDKPFDTAALLESVDVTARAPRR